MVKAAKNFSIGLNPDDFDNPSDARKSFKMGDDIPDDIAELLDDDMILERVAKSNPDLLSREQLLVMAGLASEDGAPMSEPEQEFNEEEFREGMKQFSSKQDLVDWAKEVVGVELDKDDGTREDLEDWITLAAQGIDPFEDDDEEEN